MTTSKSAMPTIAATTTSYSASSFTSTWTTPTITPPSAQNNPFVWQSSAPTGTVFIAVGSIAGFILLCLVGFLIVRSLIAKRAAKRSLTLTDSSSSTFHRGGSTEKLMSQSTFTSTTNLRKSMSQGKIPLLYDSQYDNSVDDLSEAYLKTSEGFFSTLEKPDNTNRRSMFISPTAEVMNLNKGHNRGTSSVSILGGGVIVDSSSSRKNYHERNESYGNYTNPELQSPERGSNRAYKPRTKAVPSQYLESMIGDA